MFIATLIAADRLSSGDISEAADRIAAAGAKLTGQSWIEEDKACDLSFEGPERDAVRAALEGHFDRVDVIVQPVAMRRKKLMVADMDSTMITVECIDELADYAGIKAEVAEVTERAMRGELAFADALRARVALLEGLDEAVIGRCLDDRVRITPGAEILVRTMRREGAESILVSGGFSRFADPVAERIGFSRAVSNTLGIAGGKLDGTVHGAIVGPEAKLQALVDAAALAEVELTQCLAIGDGANDIPMLEAAGLGVAYHAKSIVAAAAAGRLDHCDLTALLYAQGYARREWAEA